MKRGIKILAAFLIFFGGTIVVNKFRLRYDWKTTFLRTVMTPMTGTVWAEKFSESSFAKIKKGMLSEEVFALLGEPLRKSCDEEGCSWAFTGQDTDTADSDRRWISFDIHNRVIEIRHEFHID